MIRLLQGILVFMFAAPLVAAQTNTLAAARPTASSMEAAARQPNKQELLERIALYEAAARKAKIDHLDPEILAKLYEHLGDFYADAALYLKSEEAMRLAIAYLKNGPQKELANEMGQLATVHLELGSPKQTERDEMQVLRIREAIGDPVDIALVWNDLASLYDEEQKFKKAVDYGGRAFQVLGNRPDVSASDSIAVRQAFGFALTGARDCARGIPILKDALAIAQGSYGEQSIDLGYAEYVLGIGYWHCGDQRNAAAWLQRGTTHMKADFGWNQTIYLNAMRQYARFLRSTGQPEAAASAESVVNQANALVDAQSFTGTAEGFRSAGVK